MRSSGKLIQKFLFVDFGSFKLRGSINLELGRLINVSSNQYSVSLSLADIFLINKIVCEH